MQRIPDNLRRLYVQEDRIRKRTLAYIGTDPALMLNLEVIGQAMTVTDALRRIKTDDPSLMWVQIMGMRIFNGFASALNLMSIGYYQKSAMIIRDLLETSWLIDLFRLDHDEIIAWNTLSEDERTAHFKPWKVRKKLNNLYGTPSIRNELYKTLCELAGHPTPQSGFMLMPEGSGAQHGPFFDGKMLGAMLDETSRVGIQVGDTVSDFFNRPTISLEGWLPVYDQMLIKREEWTKVHYPELPKH